MTKPLLGVFLAVTLLGTPLSAQQWKAALKQAQKTAAKASRQYNGNLNQALENSIERALETSAALSKAENSFLESAKLFKKSYGFSKYATGWKLSENREWLIQRIINERVVRQMEKNKEKWTPFIKQTPIQTPQQLAHLIPADAKYVFMGEYHEDVLNLHLQKTVVEFARLHPQKQVIVFTEFVYDTNDPFDRTLQFFSKDLNQYVRNNIPWVGLEEPAPEEIDMLSMDLSRTIEASLLGIKTRNEHWLNLLKIYRKHYPNAVFFVHSGAFHSDYQAAHAVSNAFKPQETFVMQFIPFDSKQPLYPLVLEQFHLVTKGKYLRPGTLIWANKDFARMTGFDVQVILPLR